MSTDPNEGTTFCTAPFECQFGLDAKHNAEHMQAMRYTTAMHMLRQLSENQPCMVLALCPNKTCGESPEERWDVIDVCGDPYDGNMPIGHGVIASDACPLNAVATAVARLAELEGGAL